MQGRINWSGLSSYTVQPADMELFQTYLNNYDSELLEGSRSKGVIFGCRITTVSALQINISAGLVKMPDGKLITVPSSNVTLSTADATNPRIDRVEVGYTSTNGSTVVDVNGVNKTLDYQYVPAVAALAGTPAGSPSAPAATGSKLSLGYVAVAATQTVLSGSDISQVEDAGFESSAIQLGNKNYLIRANQTSGLLQFSNDNGARWSAFGSGGGGGGSAQWQNVSGLAPAESLEYDEKVFLFQQSALQAITLWVKVPSSYLPGSPITLKMSHYGPSSSNKYKFETLTSLVRNGTDAITSTTNQHTSTNGSVTQTVANKLNEVSYDLTDEDGLINAVAVSAGDLLKVILSRVASAATEDTADIRAIPSSTEILFS